MENEKEILERIEEWEDAYQKIQNRTTVAYIDLLNSMRFDYEQVGMLEKAHAACEEAIECILNKKFQTTKDASLILSLYDTMARCGDFRAYCVALEWNRPIDKQFFLPRKRILEKGTATSSVKNQRFLPASPKGKPWAPEAPVR